MNRLILVLSFLVSLSLCHAYDFEVDGLCYSFIEGSDTTVMVTHRDATAGGYTNLSGAVVIPGTVSYNGVNYTVSQIGLRAFEACTAITSVTLPNTLSVISTHAFYDCKGLTSIELPESVTELSFSAFSDCTNLKKVLFNCVAVESETKFPGSVEEFVFGDNVSVIPPGCCDGLSKLTSVTIPKSVKTIGNNAFRGCTNVTELAWNPVQRVGGGSYYTLPPSSNLERLSIGDGVEVIPSSIAEGSKIASIEFPGSVKEMGPLAFKDCKNLKSIHIPASVSMIFDGEYGTFRGCTNLNEITVDPANPKYDSRENCNAIIHTQAAELRVGCCSTVIPEDLKYIGPFAFENCEGLVQIVLPDSLISIGRNAFYGCTGLSEVSFPNTVTQIDKLAFAYCQKLSKITALSNFPPQIDATYANGTFRSVNTSIPLYVPAGAKERYAWAAGWKNFGNIIELEPTGEQLNQYDVNFDGKVDIEDINDVINYMLGKY